MYAHTLLRNNANDRQEQLLSPDLNPNSGVRTYVFHRAERVRLSILWIFGAQSPCDTPALQDKKMAHSSTGVGGSEGEGVGKVGKEVVERVPSGSGQLFLQLFSSLTADTCRGYRGFKYARRRHLQIFQFMEPLSCHCSRWLVR